MSSIEGAIRDAITAKLEEGVIEKAVAENFEKGINKVLENLFCGYRGDVSEVIAGKIKEVMIDRLSSFDYTGYITKLDAVLVEILKHTALDHKKILENFKDLMVGEEFTDTVKVSEIFERFKEHVATEVDTSDLEVDTDDEPSYEAVNVTMEVEREDKRTWSSFEYAKIVFECEKDKDLNCEIRLSKWRDEHWSPRVEINDSISSLRYLDKFKIYLLRLNQSTSKIELDSDYLEDEVQPKAEPEASFT